MLETAIGYRGQARYVAFYWMPAGDEAMVDDGQVSYDGNWSAYLTYVRHPRVHLTLGPYNFGSSDYPAQHWLILDRTARLIYALDEADARRMLREQHAPQYGEPLPITIEDWTAFTEELNRRMHAVLSDPEQHRLVLQQLAEEDALVRDLQRWLDQVPH
jgi:hypothetical protein